MKTIAWTPILTKEEAKSTIWEEIDDEKIKLDLDDLE